MALSQLINQFTIKDQTYSITGTALRNGENEIENIMFTIVNITGQIEAERKNKLQLRLLEILGRKEHFTRFIKESRELWSECKELIKDPANQNKVRMNLHTLKGNMGCFSLNEQSDLIHQVESFPEIKIEHVEQTEQSFKDFLKEHHDLLNMSYEDEQKIAIRLDPDELAQFKTESKKAGSKEEYQSLINSFIRKASFVKAEVLIGALPDLMLRLAKRLNKPIKLDIEGGHLKMDQELLQPIFTNLPHLARNSLDHGIEHPDDRTLKDQIASIKLGFAIEKEQWKISFSDDGRGLDPQMICLKALEKEIINKQEASQLSDLEKINLIFHPGFSTRSEASETSGRGVGMSAIKEAVDQAQGKIEIRSQIGKGSTFTIHIPCRK